MTIYSVEVLLSQIGTNLLFHVQFQLLLHDLHTDFSRGRSGGLVFPSLSELSTVYCDTECLYKPSRLEHLASKSNRGKKRFWPFFLSPLNLTWPCISECLISETHQALWRLVAPTARKVTENPINPPFFPETEIRNKHGAVERAWDWCGQFVKEVSSREALWELGGHS